MNNRTSVHDDGSVVCELHSVQAKPRTAIPLFSITAANHSLAPATQKQDLESKGLYEGHGPDGRQDRCPNCRSEDNPARGRDYGFSLVGSSLQQRYKEAAESTHQRPDVVSPRTEMRREGRVGLHAA